MPNITKPGHVDIAIDVEGDIYWNGERVGRAEQTARFAQTAKRSPQR